MARRSAMSQKEKLDILHEYGLDRDRRIIYLSSGFNDDGNETGVDASMMLRFKKNLHFLENDQLPEGADDGITVICNSMGGDLYSGIGGIFDAIRLCEKHVTTFAQGSIMSAAAIIFQAGDTRFVTENTVMMIHHTWGGIDDSHGKTSERDSDECKRWRNWQDEMFLHIMQKKKPELTLRDVHDMHIANTYFDAKRMIEYNLADKIIVPRSFPAHLR